MARRYSLEPFFAVTGWTLGRVCEVAPCNGAEYRTRMERGVTERIADRLATAAGCHPFEVWPELMTAALEADRDEEEARRARRRQQWAASSRRRWANDPEHRARRAEYMRRYRAEAREVLARQKRAWIEANRERVRAKNREAMRRLRARRQEAA